MKRNVIALALCMSLLALLMAPVMGTLASEVVTPSEPSSSEQVGGEEPEFGETDKTESEEPETVEPTQLQAGAKATYASVFANEQSAQVQVKAIGGVEPYTLVWKAFMNCVAVAEGSVEFGSDEIAKIEYMPTELGSVAFQMIVTDANGEQVQLEAAVEAAVREVEDKSVWQAQIAEVELTGDWAKDILAIAQTQIGYKESQVNFVIEGGQKHGYTRYGDHFSVPYAEWCSLFVRFCIDQAGIEENDYPQDSSCFYWKEKLTEEGCFAGADYAPVPGDLFFINLDDIADPDHMGIVLEGGATLKVIEGNSEYSDVRIVEYEANDPRIVGYGLTTELMEKAAAAEEPAEEDILGETSIDAAEEADVVQPVSGAWDATQKQASFTFAHADATAYQWLCAPITAEGYDWQKLDGTNTDTLTVAITAENLASVYQCAAKLSDGAVVYSEPATVLPPETAAWFALESDGSSAMLMRALTAKSLDSLVIENSQLIHVRTGAPMAEIDPETGAISDIETGLVIAYIKDDIIYPAAVPAQEPAQTETPAENGGEQA